MDAIFLSSLMAFSDACLDICTESVYDLGVSIITAVGARGTLRFPRLYSVDEYIRHWSSRLNARWFAIFPVSLSLALILGRIERETAYVGWRGRSKHWGGRRAVDDHIHGNFIYMPFVFSVEYAAYQKRLARLLPRRQSNGFFQWLLVWI